MNNNCLSLSCQEVRVKLRSTHKRQSIAQEPPSPLRFAPKRLSLENFRLKFHQKDRLPRPQLPVLSFPNTMRRDSCWKARTITAPLNDACDESSAVELTHLPRHADILVDNRLIVRDHVLVRRLWIRRFLKRVCWPAEKVPP